MKSKAVEDRKNDRFPRTQAVEVYLLLRKIYTVTEKMIDSDFRSLDLSSSQYTVLRYLEDDEAIPLSELSRRLTQGKSNLTTLIPRMEKKGLVQTVSLPGDKRYNLVRLTETGRKLRDQVVPAHRRLLEGMLHLLTPEQQEQIIHMLRQMDRGLQEIIQEKS